jgi:hypothetical protein
MSISIPPESIASRSGLHLPRASKARESIPRTAPISGRHRKSFDGFSVNR